MGRHKNDGLGKTGGRQKGTPNKNKPIKTWLKEHSSKYFEPSIEEVDEDGNPTGRMISQYEQDLKDMKPTDRVNAELQLLRYHTPQMQATAVDMTVSDEKSTISDRLQRLSAGEDIPSPSE